MPNKKNLLIYAHYYIPDGTIVGRVGIKNKRSIKDGRKQN